MKQSKLILFESTIANFRLSIDTIYEKDKEDGSTQQYVYINPKNNNGTFKPSVFLVFAYLDPTNALAKQSFYASIPHLYRLREAFRTAVAMLEDPNAFIDINGALGVAPGYADPIIIEQTSGKWMSLALAAYKDNTGTAYQTGVAIQNSESNGFSSLLTANEFKSVYDLIEHMDFATIENQAVILELLSRNSGNGGQAIKKAPTYQNNYANNSGYAPQVPIRQVQPKPVAQQQPAQESAIHSYSPTYYNTYANGGTGTPTYQQPQRQAAPVIPKPAQPATNNAETLAPRQPSAPKITMNAVKDIEIEEMDLDDSASVASIFED